MHGGGSPDGAKLLVRLLTPWEEFANYAKNLINIDEEVAEPQKPKK
jgi:4-hydroxybutyryl-CoA dehydratase/vinylacetyl-CoA-Delta-isomerase